MDATSLPPDDRPPAPPARRRPSRGLLWASALAVVVLAIATFVAFTSDGGDDGVTRLDPDAQAPIDGGLAGTDVTGSALPGLTYQTFDGADVALRPEGKVLLVNFWASTCGPCLAEMPALESAYEANAGRVDFLGLQTAERAEAGLAMIQRTGIRYDVGRDPTGQLLQALGGVGLPRTVVVRADGTIAYSHSGPLTAEQIQTAIDGALAG